METFYSDSVEEERRQKEGDRKRAMQRIVNAYHRLFECDDGEVVLNDLVARFGFNHPAFLPTATRPGMPIQYDGFYGAIRDGQRQVYLHIQDQLRLPAKGDANIEPTDKVLTGIANP